MPRLRRSESNGPRRRQAWRGLAGVGVLVLLATAALVVLSEPSSRLKAANFDKIRPGAPRPEVERLLGGPPGDYGRYADGLVENGDGSVAQIFAVPDTDGAVVARWEDDRNCFFVFFDTTGRVVAASKMNAVRRSKAGLVRRMLNSARSALCGT